MGVKPEDIERAIAGGNKILAQLKRVCPRPEELEVSAKPNPEYVPARKKRVRQDSKPLLNKLEAEFLAKWNREHSLNSSLLSQALRFRLANGLWYKPDFVWLHHSPIIAYEIKGPHAHRGGFENLKMAASVYPHIVWVLWWKERGQWQEQKVLP